MGRKNTPRGFTRISAVRNFTRQHRLTVPAGIARRIGPDALFKVELVEEGILYRYVDGKIAEPPPPPKWLRPD